jgi:predicted translin family RNA/ssDNA-binding protein
MAHFTGGQTEMDEAVQSAVDISKTIQSAFTTKISGETIFKQLKDSMKKFNEETVNNSKSLTTINKALNEYEKIVKKSEVSTKEKAQATKQLK